MRATFALALVAATALALPGAGAASLAFSIKDFFFDPGTGHGNAGDVATWTNLGNAPHTVTCTGGTCPYSSGVLSKGDAFTVALVGSGTQTYFCGIHPSMTAKLHVGTSSAASPDLAPDAASIAGKRPALVRVAGQDVLADPTRATLSVDVQNLGGSTSSPATVEFRAPGTNMQTSTVASATVPALAPGATFTVKADWVGAPNGSTSVTVVVDPANGLVEGSETNNVASAPVTIAFP